MRPEDEERFAAFVRDRGEHHLRVATLLTGSPTEAEDLVRAALAGLPRRQRAVLVLRYFEDLPEASVAELLGCSAGTIKTHAHRGLRALRASLGDLGPFAVNETAGPDGGER